MGGKHASLSRVVFLGANVNVARYPAVTGHVQLMGEQFDLVRPIPCSLDLRLSLAVSRTQSRVDLPLHAVSITQLTRNSHS